MSCYIPSFTTVFRRASCTPIYIRERESFGANAGQAEHSQRSHYTSDLQGLCSKIVAFLGYD